ncbi:MAG: polymorphic toxin type 23 domain-containing protein [Bacteroidota bacterium]
MRKTWAAIRLRPAGLLVLVLGFTIPSFAQSYQYAWNQELTSSSSLVAYPTLRTGTHVNEIGFAVAPGIRHELGKTHVLSVSLTTLGRFNASNMGISGTSGSFITRLDTRFGWGLAPSSLPGAALPSSKHTIGYSLIRYGSTDGTTQLSGSVSYASLLGKGRVSLTIENDALAFRGLDEFRTGAGSLDYHWERRKALVGIGVGVWLWTGTTKGLPNLDFGQQYAMTGQFGSAYSHGILSLRLHYNAYTLELGYDADSIRRGVQDTIHEWIDDGTIPAGTEARNRFFLTFRVNATDWQY